MNGTVRRLFAPVVATAAVGILAVGIVGATQGRGNSDTPNTTTGVVDQMGTGTATMEEYIAALAKNLGITEEKLKAAITTTANGFIDQAVTDGELTQEQADAIKAAIASGGFKGLGLGGFGLRGFGHGHHEGFGGALKVVSDDVAAYLGMTTDELHTALERGKSLADVAGDQGKDLDGLKKVITDGAKAQLDQAVKDGNVTQIQADAIAKRLGDNLDNLVNKTFDGERGGFGHHRGHGGGIFGTGVGPDIGEGF